MSRRVTAVPQQSDRHTVRYTDRTRKFAGLVTDFWNKQKGEACFAFETKTFGGLITDVIVAATKLPPPTTIKNSFHFCQVSNNEWRSTRQVDQHLLTNFFPW